MRVLCRPSDDTACGMYRVREPVRVLAAHGHDVALFDRFVTSDDPPDVIVIQRPLRAETAQQFIPACHDQGVAVVVEIDDDLCALQNGTPGYRAVNIDPGHNPKWMAAACRQADLVTCTTPALAARYGFGHAVVIPNYIPARFLRVQANRWDLEVGWAGLTSTHPGDLPVMGHGAAEAVASGPYRWRSIGDAVSAHIARIPHQYREHTHIVPLHDYPDAVAQLTVGVVPLRDTVFNAAKSGLKALEYAALGVVPVVTPSPDNRRVMTTIQGFQARRPREWKRGILDAFRDHEQIAAFNREQIAAHHLVETNAWRWAEAWAQARTNFLHRKVKA